WPLSAYSSTNVGIVSWLTTAQNGQRRSTHSVSTTGASTSPIAIGSSGSRRTNSYSWPSPSGSAALPSSPASPTSAAGSAGGAVAVGDPSGRNCAAATRRRNATAAPSTTFSFRARWYFVSRATARSDGAGFTGDRRLSTGRLSHIVDYARK